MILAALGLTFIVTHSKIFKPVREYVTTKKIKFLDENINCPQCFGFWAGLIVALFIGEGFLYLPLANSFLAFFTERIINYLRK